MPAAADSVFHVKWYCSTGVCPRGAKVRLRCGRSLNPDSSMKTMVRPCFWAFFLLRPAHSLPAANRFLIPFQGASHGSLATPSQFPENPPDVDVRVPDPAFAFDQIGHAPTGPQPRLISQRFRPPLQPFHDPSAVGGAQSWLATGATGFP